jgi:TolA-binding protein
MRWMPGVVWLGVLLWLGLRAWAVADPGPYAQRLTQALGFMQQGAWQQAMGAIGELDKKAALTPELARLWFVRGTLAQKLQDPDTARQAFERVWQGYPPLADYAAWAMVQYDAAHDLLPTLQKTVTTLAERYPFSRLLPESRLVLARTQHRLGHSAPARATLERLVRDTAAQSIHAEAMAFLGQVYEDRGEFDLAAQILQRLGETHPRDKQAAMALRHSRELLARLSAPPRPPEPEQLLASIDRLAEGQLWQEIEARFNTLNTLSLPETLVVKVLMKRGAVAVRRGSLTEAQAVLQEVLRRYPQGGHLPEAYYLLGSVYQRLNQPTDSVQVYEMGLAQPPTFPWTAKTLWALARLQEERQEPIRAIELYQRLAQDFPTYEQAESSLWRAGWLQYCQRHTQAATTLWQSFEQRFPRSPLLPQVLYWQARAVQQEGQQDTAIRLYQRITLCIITRPRDTPVRRRLADAPRWLLTRHSQRLLCAFRILPCSRNSPRGNPAKPVSTSCACRNCSSYRCLNRQGKKSAASLHCCPALQRPSTSSPRCMSITSNTRQPSGHSAVCSRP